MIDSQSSEMSSSGMVLRTSDWVGSKLGSAGGAALPDDAAPRFGAFFEGNVLLLKHA
tara:strand:- start:5 stop:175 length:171 start_codon:yes stop_codon:yes gene_type:complete